MFLVFFRFGLFILSSLLTKISQLNTHVKEMVNTVHYYKTQTAFSMS